MPEDQRAPGTDALSVLASGRIEVQGRMPWSSNGTYLTVVAAGDTALEAVYKPGRGERPLWDFPDGLYRREVAAFELACRLGWELVPETVLRDDGPLGAGSLQRFVHADFEQHYFSLLEAGDHHDQLRLMAAFDVVANNADRKGGHCLIDAAGHLWGIDHGLCFHESSKLRTVIWDFAGDDLQEDTLDDLRRLIGEGPGPALETLLNTGELQAMERRARALVRAGRLPAPRSERPYPWPLV